MSAVKGSSSSKKRKHGAVNVAGDASMSKAGQQPASPSSSSSKMISVSVSKDAQRSGLLPLLASSPAVSLTPDVSLSLYRSSGKGKQREAAILHGESAKLEWTSSNRLHGLSETGERVHNEEENDTECSASYALALYDPSTSQLSVINAPLHILSHIPKRLKALPSMISDAPSAGGNAAARAELGLSFGTKKSIKAIRAAERNKVDAGGADLQSVQDVVMQDLSKGLETLPEGVGGTPRRYGRAPMDEEEAAAAKAGELATIIANARKTGRPVPNPEALVPEQVYNVIGDVMTEKELEAINPTPLLRAAADEAKEDILRNLPFKTSKWVNDRVMDLVKNSPKDKRRKLKQLVWISGMMTILKSTGRGVDPTKDGDLKRRYGGGLSGNVCPPACSASLLERFAESVRGSQSVAMSSSAETRVLCHLFLACLHYDSYNCLDLNLLGSDLSLAPRKPTDIAKSLGCRVITPKGTEVDKITAKWQNEGKVSSLPGAGGATSGKLKVASLKIPLEFPKDRKAPAKR